jgi:hypothetical protein
MLIAAQAYTFTPPISSVISPTTTGGRQSRWQGVQKSYMGVGKYRRQAVMIELINDV